MSKIKFKKSPDAEPIDLITQTEAAALKNASISTVGQWVRRGRVHSFNKFGRRLVSKAEVLAYKPETNKGGRPSSKIGKKGRKKTG